MDKMIALILHYKFDLGGYTTNDLRRAWHRYDLAWVQSAIVECIFQGRFKVIAVLQLLATWERRHSVKVHFAKDYERLICQGVLPQEETDPEPVTTNPPLNQELYRQAIGTVTWQAQDSPFLQKLKNMCNKNPDQPYPSGSAVVDLKKVFENPVS